MQISHHKLDLNELQSVDLKEVVEHKVRQAYKALHKPVLVEDVSLEFNALNSLPGTFIKFFVDYTGLEATCRMLDGFSDRSAVPRCAYGYFDGKELKFFEGSARGTIAEHPSSGTRGFG